MTVKNTLNLNKNKYLIRPFPSFKLYSGSVRLMRLTAFTDHHPHSELSLVHKLSSWDIKDKSVPSG